jgi:ATPase subunit of ABC transporter with duplicated ATPase domains
VSSFNFRGTDQQKMVGALSGGERNRVHLAKLLQSGGNVLLLDEPTNDLGIDRHVRFFQGNVSDYEGPSATRSWVPPPTSPIASATGAPSRRSPR